ncbi:MAG: hypothetical protein M1819_002966 [Sarea resinae]|nr:MAG: hypothetical protein M1819_002966 [Sarea resinae]
MSVPSIAADDHRAYMRYALALAAQSPPKPTNFCVGAVLVSSATNTILSTGYTQELPGNTHAEQCCFMKFAARHQVPEERIGEVLPKHAVLYTTMEPCAKRLSENVPCVERILRTTRAGEGSGIEKVYSGVREPETFVGENAGRTKLEEAGIECVLVEGLEGEILEVATAGHTKHE